MFPNQRRNYKIKKCENKKIKGITPKIVQRPSKTIHETLECESEESHGNRESRRRRRPAGRQRGRRGRPNQNDGLRKDTERRSASVPAAVHAVGGFLQLHPRSGRRREQKGGEKRKKKKKTSDQT